MLSADEFMAVGEPRFFAPKYKLVPLKLQGALPQIPTNLHEAFF